MLTKLFQNTIVKPKIYQNTTLNTAKHFLRTYPVPHAQKRCFGIQYSSANTYSVRRKLENIPAELMYNIVVDVDNYPEFLKTVDKTTITNQ